MGDFGKNQSVADALDAYLELERPKFAALIDSPWGSGKTWFIRTYFEEKKNENRFPSFFLQSICV